MSPFGDVPIWVMVLAATVAAVLLAVIGTWPVCALLLRAYRRRVDRGMRSTASDPEAASSPPPGPPAPPSRSTRPDPPQIAIRQVESGYAPAPLVQRAEHRARWASRIFGLAGLAHAAGATAAYHLVNEMEWRPLRAAAYVVLLGWPILPTVLALSSVRQRLQWALYAGYLALVVALLWVAGVPTSEVLVMAIPALFIVATGAPALRGAAWLVAPGLTVLGLAVAAVYPVLVYLRYRAPFDRYAWSLLGAGVGLLVLLVAYGWAVARLYQAKWASDQALLILQWWLVTSLSCSLLLGTQGASAALLGLSPYGLLLLILLLAALLARRYRELPVRLLLLRTFGAPQRSSRLLHDLARQWRWVGSVELITGTDLATEILEPDEFLDFVRGRLAGRFVRDQASVARRLRDLDLLPDRDGRYRVNELLCHDDTWRPTVQGLVEEVDAVLLDLRGYSAANAGVAHELELLVARVPLPRVVALVDATTDLRALDQALARAAGLAPPTSPLATDPAPELRTVFLGLPGGDDPRTLIRALAVAASASPSRQAVPSEQAPQQTGHLPPARAGLDVDKT